MGDVGDDYRALKESRTIKKLQNLKKSTAILDDKGIIYESKSGGTYLIITKIGYDVVDFWPSTGKYKFRKQRKYKRGVFNLIRDLNKNEN